MAGPQPRPEPCFSDDGLSVGVPLTQGKFAWVDAADWPLVQPFNWYAMRQPRDRWYARTERWLGGGRKIGTYIHRMILGDIATHIDHADGDGLNNRRTNLRPATRVQNLANARRRIDSRHQYKGVVLLPHGRWIARCQRRHLGTFDNEEAAARAYDAHVRVLFGEYALLNFPEER